MRRPGRDAPRGMVSPGEWASCPAAASICLVLRRPWTISATASCEECRTVHSLKYRHYPPRSQANMKKVNKIKARSGAPGFRKFAAVRSDRGLFLFLGLLVRRDQTFEAL